MKSFLIHPIELALICLVSAPLIVATPVALGEIIQDVQVATDVINWSSDQ